MYSKTFVDFIVDFNALQKNLKFNQYLSVTFHWYLHCKVVHLKQICIHVIPCTII